MRLRQALIEQSPSLALQRAAADEIAALDAMILKQREMLEEVSGVPVVVTPEMARAFSAALDPGGWEKAPEEQRQEVIDNLKPALAAMLTASPQPEAQATLTITAHNGDKLVCHGSAADMMTLECIVKAKAAPQPEAQPSSEFDSPLSDFREGQWWVLELDAAARKNDATPDFKRAVAVVHHLLRAAAAPSAQAPQPEAQPQWQLPAQRLVQWLHCMSYNDSYFGEPAGYLKQCVNELKHLLPPNEVRAAPSAQAEPRWVSVTEQAMQAAAKLSQAEPRKPNYRAECWPESPHNKQAEQGGTK